MSLTTKTKKQVVADFAQNPKDTGSTEVQCAIITQQVLSLTEHLKIHRKDFSSRRGLLILVGKRRRLLNYLKAESSARYEALIKKLDLRK